MKKIISIFSLLLLVSIATKAQGLNADTIKAQLVKDWERAKLYTTQYLDAMPAGKYAARAVDSIRSFSEQMLHLASGNIGLVANGTGQQRIFPGFNMEKSSGAQSADSVRYYVTASYDFAINGIKAMDASKLAEHVKRGNLDETRLTWILKAFEHQSHHRGQCTIYIRLQGIRPPNEMLF